MIKLSKLNLDNFIRKFNNSELSELYINGGKFYYCFLSRNEKDEILFINNVDDGNLIAEFEIEAIINMYYIEFCNDEYNKVIFR